MEAKAASVCAAAAAVAAGFYIYFGPATPERKSNKRGLCAGLYNIGNTCFMNSIFQGLASLQSFVMWLEGYCWEYGEKKEQVRLGNVLGDLLKELNLEWNDDEAALTARPLIQVLHHHGWVITPDQQDAHEFFQVLFSTLEDEMGQLPAVLDFNRIATFEKEKDETDGSAVHRNHTPVLRRCSRRRSPFRGLIASQLVCKTCLTKSPVRFDGCDSLSLSLPPTIQIGLSIEDLLRQFVCSETVNAVECKECARKENQQNETKSTFVKRLTIGKVPQCLCIHIQRTYWHTDGIPYKNTMYIKYPEYLNLAPFMYMPAASSPRKFRLDVPFPYSGASTPEGSITPTNTNDLKAELGQLLTSSLLSSFSFSRQNSETRTRTVYRLTAVTAHLGDVNDGHYVTYRRFEPSNSSKPSLWVYTSDDVVETATLDQVLSCNAYMLFYERCPAGFEFEPLFDKIDEEVTKNFGFADDQD
ncbi:ubiquitin carboxyl-terminal hydrolase 30 homolog isoform X2 [Exaiptasia diaphana]|uniref:Ubiquitin carboxyl-terminal hydrolase n=1 Tax=Exaiptasia diaphana TaxID=2652724 RepID=A0A913X1Z1_EXADI|nr:ubiquitin carboxyl-terminal hydrolase 30 homolog isoform X2 [Exaiptasia diaphana]KXJ15963.1 Ubiquitin carboxyl-terminal hydrolase 30 [Exaiptasia diaphana]